MKEPYYEVSPERLREITEKQLADMSQCQKNAHVAVCAHLTVGYVRQHLGGGKERGWWQCTECEAKFVPSGTIRA